jgi:cyclophilin family peptidyl-prolyl cis-trans isomerase
LANTVRSIGVLFVLVAFACGDDEVSTPTTPPADEPAASTLTTPPAEETAMPEQTTPPERKSYDAPPPMTLDLSKQYTATIVMEKGGEIAIELFAKEAPNTVNSFVFLAREGYYDGVTFHRVIPNFMAQAGDPTGTGSGGPGYQFDDEFDPSRRHDSAGVLSMANAGVRGGRGTNGSQFFITFGPTPNLNDVHSVFGKVISGMNVVLGIRERNPANDRNPGDVMTTIKIEEK